MVVYCCQDLIFATKIRSTAESLGVTTRPVRDATMLENRFDRIDDGKPHDPVTALMVDLDTGQEGLALLEQAKRHDPNLPVVAFGAHVATELLQAARDRGADFVLPRSAFTARLPELLRRFGGRE